MNRVQPGDLLIPYVIVGKGDSPSVVSVRICGREIPVVTDPLIRDFHRAGLFLPDELHSFRLGEDEEGSA